MIRMPGNGLRRWMPPQILESRRPFLLAQHRPSGRHALRKSCKIESRIGDDDPLQYADEDDAERADDGQNELAPAHREESPQTHQDRGDLIAATMRIAASADCGRLRTKPGRNNSMTSTTAADTTPVNCVFAPDCSATAVREPLVLIGNPWKNPASTFAAPIPPSS